MGTRREKAISKIRTLEKRLEITTTQHVLDNIEREINSLQLKYEIALEDIKPTSIRKTLPWLSESVLRSLEG